MRIFTTVAMGVALAFTAGAALPSQQSLPRVSAASGSHLMKSQHVSRADIGKLHSNGALRKSRKVAPVHKVGAPSEHDAVLGAPEGEAVRYVKTGPGYMAIYTFVMDTSVTGSVSDVVMKDGKFFMSNPCGASLVPGWVEGTVEGDEVTLKLPQMVDGYVNEFGDTQAIYCMALEYVPEEPDSEDGWYYPTESQEYKFKVSADGSLVPEDTNIGLGLCSWLSDEDESDPEAGDWEWIGDIDLATGYSVLDKSPVAAPDGLGFEKWTMICDKTGQPVELAFGDDNTVYFRNFFVPEEDVHSCLVGKLDGDKITFDDGQYLGVDVSVMKTSYFVSGTFAREFDEMYGMYFYNFTPGGDLVFTLDADKKKMTCGDGGFIISADPDEIVYLYEFVFPELVKFNPDAVVSALNAPELMVYYEEDDYYPNECAFYVSNVDVDGNMLDTDKLYYRFFVDDELFTFYDDEYAGVDGEMTDVPFNFESDDIYVDGNMRDVIIYMSDIEKVEVQMLYKNGDETIYSEKALMFGSDGIRGAGIEDVVSSVYYDLAGRRVSCPSAGVGIRLDRLSDGSVRAAKVMVK